MTDLPYTQDISTALDAKIQTHGVSQKDIDAALARIPDIAKALKARNEKGELSVLSEPFKTDDLTIIERVAQKIQQ